jgi:hypothetical protein
MAVARVAYWKFKPDLKPLASVVERPPPELHVYDVDLPRLRRDLGNRLDHRLRSGDDVKEANA